MEPLLAGPPVPTGNGGLSTGRRAIVHPRVVSVVSNTEPLILLVEDDPDLVATLRGVLTASGYRVHVAVTAAAALAAIEQIEPQLILLDVILPDADGLVLAAKLKSVRSIPIVILSGRARQADRVLGLKLGADDFIAKPFDIEELLARLQAVLRRALPPLPSPAASDRITIGELTLIPTRAQVTVRGEMVRLTPTEYRLLQALALHVNELMLREDLIKQVWGYAHPDADASHLVDVQLARLRQKLFHARLYSPHIVTMRGRGFTFVYEAPNPVEAETTVEPVDYAGQPPGSVF